MSDANELSTVPNPAAADKNWDANMLFLPTRGNTCLDRQRRHRPRLCCIVVKHYRWGAGVNPPTVNLHGQVTLQCIHCSSTFARDLKRHGCRKSAEVVAPSTPSPPPPHRCMFPWRDACKNDILVSLKTLHGISHTHTHTEAGIQAFSMTNKHVIYVCQWGGILLTAGRMCIMWIKSDPKYDQRFGTKEKASGFEPLCGIFIHFSVY